MFKMFLFLMRMPGFNLVLPILSIAYSYKINTPHKTQDEAIPFSV